MGRSRQSGSSPAEGRSPDTGGGYAALAYLITGVGLYGGLGWLLDRWLGTAFLLPAGIVAGAGLGIFLVIRRFGRDTPAPPADSGRGDDETPDSKRR